MIIRKNTTRILALLVFAVFDMQAFASIQDVTRSDSDSVAVRQILCVSDPQNSPTLYPTIPTSPQAEAFQRVGDYTVDNASGIPDISIPLYEINHHGYKIPLRLRYIATPLKPGYNYDVTGIGWSLTFGSCITRTIESLPDEDTNFNLSTEHLQDYFTNRPNGISEELNMYNWQFDKFNAVLPDGRSFNFFICNDQYQGLHYVVSDKRFKISKSSDLSCFTVTDETGIVYTFDVTDYCTDQGLYGKKVAWYLSRIDLPNTSIPIYFMYGKSIVHEHMVGFDEPIINLCHQYYCSPDEYHTNRVSAGCTFSDPAHSYRTKLITGISCGEMSVSFQYQNAASEATYNYLTSINIYDMLQSERHYNLEYRKTDLMGMPVAQLKRLVVKGPSNSTDSLVYLIDSYSISGFCGTDLWGNWSDNYYKTNVGNMNFYAEFETSENASLASTHLLTFVQKDAQDPCPYQKINLIGRSHYYEPRRAMPPSAYGILRSITYPTGGRTEFEFENHRFVTATAANGDYIATKKQRRVMEGGGFRIARIKNYTADGNIANVKCFRYGPTFNEVNSQSLNLPADPTNHSNQHIGYGEPVVDPNILTFTRFTTSGNLTTPLQYMLLGQNQYGQYGSFVNPFHDFYYVNTDWRWDCHFSPLFFQSLLGGRNAVVYPEITEYDGDIGDLDNHPENVSGKTVYKYDIYDSMGDSSYYMRLEYYDNILYVNQSYYTKDYLVRKEKYKYVSGLFMQDNSETYTYNSEGAGISDYLLADRFSPGYYPNSFLLYSLLANRYRSVSHSILSAISKSQYTNSGTLTTTETMEYNAFGLVKKRTFTGSKTRTTTITYPDPNDTTSVINRKLVNKNMMSTILQSQTLTSGFGTMMISGYKMDYAEYNEKLLPSVYYSQSVSGGSPSELEEEQRVLTYDDCNPVEVVDRSGMHTVYLWSYGNRYLVAEIKNATYSQVSSAVSNLFGKTIGELAASTPNVNALRNLRNHASLSNSMVTTWTYQPLSGITSQTDPSGNITCYDYDGLGRLREIYQYEGNVISPSNKRVIHQYTYNTITH